MAGTNLQTACRSGGGHLGWTASLREAPRTNRGCRPTRYRSSVRAVDPSELASNRSRGLERDYPRIASPAHTAGASGRDWWRTFIPRKGHWVLVDALVNKNEMARGSWHRTAMVTLWPRVSGWIDKMCDASSDGRGAVADLIRCRWLPFGPAPVASARFDLCVHPALRGWGLASPRCRRRGSSGCRCQEAARRWQGLPEVVGPEGTDASSSPPVGTSGALATAMSMGRPSR